MLAFPRRPYLAVGWFWYVVTLAPVIGLIQTGSQSRADRYTYIPMIGLSLALVWEIAERLQTWPRFRVALAAAVTAACLTLTWLQVQYWRDAMRFYQQRRRWFFTNCVASLQPAPRRTVKARRDEEAQPRQTVVLPAQADENAAGVRDVAPGWSLLVCYPRVPLRSTLGYSPAFPTGTWFPESHFRYCW